MPDLDRALAEIDAIRSQLAKGERFQGLGPTAFAATAVLAAFAAVAQGMFLPAALDHIATYLALWIAVATVAAGVIGYEMKDRTRRLHSHLAQEMIIAAVLQFLPAFVTAALLTLVLVFFAPQCLWMTPGLWQIAFGIGVFASCRFLPRLMVLVGGWYVATGLVCIALAQGTHALSPYAMGLPFGFGQLLVAVALRFSEATGE
jgi:hypothetical protein